MNTTLQHREICIDFVLTCDSRSTTIQSTNQPLTIALTLITVWLYIHTSPLTDQMKTESCTDNVNIYIDNRKIRH